MTVIEREHTDTDRDQRAAILEAAALEIELQGWEPVTMRSANGICIGGALATQLGWDGRSDLPAEFFDRITDLGLDWAEVVNFNNAVARSASEATDWLRARAAEIRDAEWAS